MATLAGCGQLHVIEQPRNRGTDQVTAGCRAVRPLPLLAGKPPKMAEKQTHRQRPHKLTHSSSLSLNRAGASKRTGRRLRKSLLYSWSLNKMVTVTTVGRYLLGVHVASRQELDELCLTAPGRQGGNPRARG